MRKQPVLAIIIPCYNEEAVLSSTIPAMGALLREMIEQGRVAPESYALYVDDGSTDETWAVIAKQHKINPRVRGIKFAGNTGHQNALLAGMASAVTKADCAITIDADLQDDIAVIPEMITRFQEGCHIVYGIRRNRSVDTWFKRTTANMFYALMKILGAPTVQNHADFRLVSKFAMEALAEYPESNLFLRSIFPSMKLHSASVYYARKERTAGETKYPFWKMVAFAVRGVTVCSPVPLRLSALLSVLTFFLAVAQSIAALHAYFTGTAVPGWTSLMLIALYLGAVQLFCMAVLGEYLAKIFTEVKHRPRYKIELEL